MIVLEAEPMEPVGAESREKGIRLVSALAFMATRDLRGEPINGREFTEAGLYDLGRVGIEKKTNTTSRKLWGRDMDSLRRMGVGMVWNQEADRFDMSWALVPGGADMTPDERFAVEAVKVVERLLVGPAGLGELAEVATMAAGEVAPLLQKLMMVGVTPYRPHDYYGFERAGGVVEMFTGSRLWGRRAR